MKKIFNRAFATFLVVVLSASVFSVPASAADFDLSPDTASVQLWNSAVNTPANVVLNAVAAYFECPATVQDAFWNLMDMAVGKTGSQSLDYMNDLVGRYNQAFNTQYHENFFNTVFKNSGALLNQTFAACFFGLGPIDFELAKAPSGLFRIREKHSGRWVVNSAGQYPYCEGGSLAPTSGGNQWVGERSCSTTKVNMKNLDTLNLLCNKIKESGTSAQIRALGTNYKAIWYNRQYYCDPEGRPFVCYANESQAAINQPRPDTSVTDKDGKPATDGTGTVINNPDNSTNIDLSGMTITLPDGTVQVADAVIYDESTKTYYIDSHDTTNNYVTYNYSWTYNINYTSITYIGQTEQYDKYYKVYYELPDGRDSADLTASDLEQLNFNIDVVNYGRYSDNASIRCLYHFDGDTKDSSYWNYCTDFTWNTGASLTYMDAGVFNGALYLDETTHDFTMNMPTALGTDEFWLSFRYYQSATVAPVRDSYLTIGGATVLFFDGRYLYNSSGIQLAQMPIGSWNEISVVRKASLLFYYLNGVYIGNVSIISNLSSAVQFHFGNQQQTYKYFDELRLLNIASFYGQTNYTCTTVPYDTNLALVLPDSRTTPVADEYWAWTNSPNTIYRYDFCQNALSFITLNSNYDGSNIFVTNSPFSPSLSGTVIGGNLGEYASILRFNPTAVISCNGNSSTQYKRRLVIYYKVGSTVYPYTVDFTLLGNGKLSGVPVRPSNSYFTTNYDDGMNYLKTWINSSVTIVRIELLTEGGTPSTYEKHSSVTGVGGQLPSLKVPTLAVKSDIDVTDQKIGGVRPSVPTKGLVWAMVENGVISSIQIYDGSAWVACDGRIFTGTRWVPYGSYNIVTLKDFYDVADASGSDFSYIYTETSFWNWWQKSWNAFTNKLFAALSSAGMDVSGGTNADGTSKSLWQRIKDAFNATLGALIEALFTLINEVLKALISLATDMLQFFFGFLTDAVMSAVKAFFGAFSDNSLFDFFKQPPVVGSDGTETDGGYGLPSEVGTGFAFISGVIMVLPPDLRSILFFGIAVMVLLGVLKLVKA